MLQHLTPKNRGLNEIQMRAFILLPIKNQPPNLKSGRVVDVLSQTTFTGA